MENPFKQYQANEEPSSDDMKDKVMASIHVKSHMVGILEFFMAIFGFALQDRHPDSSGKKGNTASSEKKDDTDYSF